MDKSKISQADTPTVGEKVRFLSAPASYLHNPSNVDVVETHMSWVFLAGDRVFKLKKPVRYDFLDFSTLKRRETVVRDEVQLNRRLAPDVYLGFRALNVAADGALTFEDTGRIADWLVEMRRLPEEKNLENLIVSETLTPYHMATVVETLAEFYGGLPPEDIAPEDYVAKFEQEHCKTKAVLTDPDFALDGEKLTEAIDVFDAEFDAAIPLLHDRVRQGRIVEGHGDLRPQHVFLTEPPAIIDCLEFNRRLRIIDPFDEIVFLSMEAAQLGADWVFETLAGALSEALDNRPPPALLSFYWRYRALLRARLTLLHLSEDKPRTSEKWRPLAWRYIALAEAADARTRLLEGQ